MLAYLSGKLTFKSPALVHMDIGGIAYEVNISLFTYTQLENKEEAKLYTYLSVKEDSHTLYGFTDMEEKQLFILLISVSGIGPNTARVILSFMNAQEVKLAILNENVVAFKKVKGVGPKTAKRVILDLKDKIAKENIDLKVSSSIPQNGLRSESVAALTALGFQKQAIEKHIDQFLKDNPDNHRVEDVIKAVLKQM